MACFIMQRIKTRLFVLSPSVSFSGVVSDALNDPYTAIKWSGGQTGTGGGLATDGAPISGNTVYFGTSPSGGELGMARLRSWSPSGGLPATGQLVVGENNDVTPHVDVGNYITIKQDFRLWSRPPRDVKDGENVTYYEDYDIAYTDQTKNWYPVSVVGVPAVARLDGGAAVVKFVGEKSFTNAHGAGFTSWEWAADGSDEGTSSSQGTVASPVTFTWHDEGIYLVSLKVTDTNGNSHTSYTWAFVYADGGGLGYDDYDTHREQLDFSSGGGVANFTVFGDADVSDFPRGALVVHAYTGTMEADYEDSYPYRENILFVGYVTHAEISQHPNDNTVILTVSTIDVLMKNLPVFPITLTDVGTPASWVQGAVITVDRLLSYLSYWRSTLANIAPITPLTYTAEIYRQDTGYVSLYDAMDGIVRSAWGRVVVNQQGVVNILRDYQLMTTGSERALGATDIGTISKSNWIAPLSLVERGDYEPSIARVKMDGVYYNGSTNVDDAKELASEAPGIIPKEYGRLNRITGLILTSQDDLNTRCGLELARNNTDYSVVRAQFVNDVRFGIAPQQHILMVIDSDDNSRGLSWRATLVPRKIVRTYDHEMGVVKVSVDFEPDANGEPGVTITKPDTPPIPDPTVTGTTDGLMTAASVYRWMNGESGWTNIVSGTNYWLGIDCDSMVLRGAIGVVEKTTDFGDTWTDVTPATNPPNDESDSPAPTVGELAFHEVHHDPGNVGTWWLAANWQNASGDWRNWVAVTTGNSFDWSWGA